MRLLLATIAGVLGIATLAPSAHAAYPDELAYTRGAETQIFDGAPLSQRSILHPGYDQLLSNDRFGEGAVQNYYAQHGFDRNFMVWAPRIVKSPAELAGRKHAGCVIPHSNGSLCSGPVRFGYGPSDDWNGNTTTKSWGDGFISLACGNFSETGNRRGPIPRFSGTKYEDRNGNGARDGGEPGIAGVTIRLYRDGQHVATTTSGGDGRYSFALDANANAAFTQGTYYVQEDVPAGYRQTGVPSPTYIPYASADQDFATGHDIGNQKVADVGVEKTAQSTVTIAGESLIWRLDVKNNGIWDAPNVVVRDTIPSEFDRTDQIDSACTLVDRNLACELGTLTPGQTRTLTFRSRARSDLAKDLVVTNRATVTTTIPDPNPANDGDDGSTKIDTRADLVASKTASDDHVLGGEAVDYVLTVRNDGPSWARSARISDTVPSELELVGPAPAGCTYTGQVVDCPVGDLAPGDSRSVSVRTRAVGSPPAAPTPTHDDHLLSFGKEERAIELAAGEQRSVPVTCPAGGIATDGSVRVDSVAQGTGTRASVVVLARRVDVGDRSTYRFVVRNTATGVAQTHLTVTCMAPTTVGGDGPAHDVTTGAVVDRTDDLAVGRRTVTLDAGLDQHATAPGFDVLSGAARLVASKQTATGWSLTYDVTADARVVSSIRPLRDRLATTASHTHLLVYTHPELTFSVPPGDSEKSIDCPDLAKGITATFDVPDGVSITGSDPRPKSRNFWFHNPTGTALPATIDLLCVDDRTGPPEDPTGIVENTVIVSSTTQDPRPGNDRASVSIVIDRMPLSGPHAAAPVAPASPASAPRGTPDAVAGPAVDAPRPAPAPPTPLPGTAPTPATPGPASPAVRLVGGPRASARVVTGTVSCAAACSVTVEVRVGGRVVAKRPLSLGAGARRAVRLRVSGPVARRLRRQGGRLVVRERRGTKAILTAGAIRR